MGLTAKGKDVLMKPQFTQIDILGEKKEVYIYASMCALGCDMEKVKCISHRALSEKGLKVTDLVRVNSRTKNVLRSRCLNWSFQIAKWMIGWLFIQSLKV